VYCHLDHQERQGTSHRMRMRDSESGLCGASICGPFRGYRNPKLLYQPRFKI